MLKTIKSYSANPFLYGLLIGFFLFQLSDPTIAAAALPWESPFQELKESITGTVAKAICAIVVCVSGVMVGMGEGGQAGRLALRLVFGISLAVGFMQILSMFS